MSDVRELLGGAPARRRFVLERAEPDGACTGVIGGSVTGLGAA